MRYVKETRIAATPEIVFQFHESPGALERLTPPWEKVKITEGGGSLKVGSRVVLRSQIGPFPLTWVAEHTEYDPPSLFADRQVSGPFAKWYHRHLFLDDGQGGTILRDEVDYEVPMGRLGQLLGGRLIANKLEKMFSYRHEVTKKAIDSRPQS